MKAFQILLVSGSLCIPAFGAEQSAKYAVEPTVPITSEIANVMQQVAPDSWVVQEVFKNRSTVSFEDWPEAKYIADSLERLSGLQFRVEPKPSDTEFITLNQAGLPPVEGLEDSVSRLPELVIDQVRTSEVESVLADSHPSEARTMLNALVKLHSDKNDPYHSWLLVKRGINSLSLGLNRDALNDFTNVMRSDFAATRVDKIKALRRIAWAQHAMGDKITAFATYDQLENYSESGYTTATARLEKCGIIMELVRSAKGFWPDCEHALHTALADIDTTYTRQRGTIELMLLEAKFYQGHYEEASELASAWLEKYPDSLRDRYMCLNFAAVSAHKRGNWAETKRFFNDMLELPDPSSPHEKFGSKGQEWDMKERAIQQLVSFANEHNPDEVEYFKNLLSEYRQNRPQGGEK